MALQKATLNSSWINSNKEFGAYISIIISTYMKIKPYI